MGRGGGGCIKGQGERTGRDTLDTSTTSQTTDGGLCDALDVVTEDLTVTFGAAFAETFATFSAYDVVLACMLEADEVGEWVCGSVRRGWCLMERKWRRDSVDKRRRCLGWGYWGWW